jgi:hypothetical protein
VKIAFVQAGTRWLLGLVDEEDAPMVMAPLAGDDESAAPVITLRHPAEVTFMPIPTPGKVEGSISMMGHAFPVWMQLPSLRVDLDSVVLGETFELPTLAQVDEAIPPLIRAYLGTLANAGIHMDGASVGRVKLGRP